MSSDEKYGTAWRDDELDAIIKVYFAMLAHELSEEPYVKARYSADLMARTGRSHRSVEFKNQNISAVLAELGLPWIPGYKPKANYQNSIFDAIDRHLTSHPQLLASVPRHQSLPTPLSTVFVDPPPPAPDDRARPERLERLVRKFDPVERDERNRSLGRAGESFVVDVERLRLTGANRSDLANRIRWVAQEDGDGAGFDILSYTSKGDERLIEVKTTNGAARTPFFMSRNEYALANERPKDWCLYRVHLFAKGPRIFTLVPPLEATVRLSPEAWRASF